MGHGRVGVLLDQDVLGAAQVAEHLHHVLVLRFGISGRPLLLVERVAAFGHHLAGGLVGLAEVAFRGGLPRSGIESDDAHAGLLAQSGQTARYRLIVFGHTAGIEHGLRLEGQSNVFVGIALLEAGGVEQPGRIVEVGENLVPGLLLGRTGHLEFVRAGGVLDDPRHQRNAAEPTRHGIEDHRADEIGLAEVVVIGDFGEVALEVGQPLEQVVGIAQRGECRSPVGGVLAGEGRAEVAGAVQRLAGSLDAEGSQPRVEVEAPFGHVLEVLEGHVAVHAGHVDVHSRLARHEVVVRDEVFRGDVQIDARGQAADGQQCGYDRFFHCFRFNVHGRGFRTRAKDRACRSCSAGTCGPGHRPGVPDRRT